MKLTMTRLATQALPLSASAPEHLGTEHFGTEHSGTEHSGSRHSGTQHSGSRHSGTRDPATEHPGTKHQAPSTRESTRVAIAGISARAAAESAARAGFDVTAIDAFGDLDQDPSVRSISLGGGFTTHAAAQAVESISCDAVVYLANFENHPTSIGALAAGRALWGNGPDVVRRVRDPAAVAEALRRRGFATPLVRWKPDTTSLQATDDEVAHANWVVKPLASGGGLRIRMWQPNTKIPRRCYLQEFIDGAPGSVVFVAAGGRAVPLGVSRQLVGEEAFGASGFQYCGNILEPPAGNRSAGRHGSVVDAASALAGAMTDEFGLVGLNGIDFIVRDGAPFTIEVNPRWCASMELVERSSALSVFAAHADACRDQTLPAFDFRRDRPNTTTGKAVVYARRDTVVGDTRAWLATPDIRDVPRAGERIPTGRPVCTVFATSTDAGACHAALVRQANRIYEQLDAWKRDPAKIV
jgi:predicted ATP-grasp superfamily ATP-dependent carboligase